MKRKKFLLRTILSIMVILIVFTFVSCGTISDKKVEAEESSLNNRQLEESPSGPFRIEFDYDKNGYDADKGVTMSYELYYSDIKKSFFGNFPDDDEETMKEIEELATERADRLMKEKTMYEYCEDSTVYWDYYKDYTWDTHYQESFELYYNEIAELNEKRKKENFPEYADIIVSISGKEHCIKHFTEFDFSYHKGLWNDAGWLYRDTIEIPPESLVTIGNGSDYGYVRVALKIKIADTGKERDSGYGFLFFKRVGDKVYFMTLYELHQNPVAMYDNVLYLNSYYNEMRAEGLLWEGYNPFGIVTYDRTDYSLYFAREGHASPYADDCKLEFFFGSVFDGREFEYVDLYFVLKSNPSKRYFIKRIEDYNEEKYGVTVDRLYDFETDEQKIAGVRFAHHEEIQVPEFLFDKQTDVIEFCVYGKEKGSDRVRLLTLNAIGYSYQGKDYQTGRPYNSLNIGCVQIGVNRYGTRCTDYYEDDLFYARLKEENE